MKEISVLVKMGNRCSNNDWRQLMFSVGINRQGPWIASNVCSSLLENANTEALFSRHVRACLVCNELS